jgi:putative thioredoxin
VVEEAPDGAEDRALERKRREQLCPRCLAVLGIGGLLLVDQAPDLLEGLLADEAGQEAAEDADRDEEDLAHEGLRTPAALTETFPGRCDAWPILLAMATDVTTDTFEQSVIERSREAPVVVDFWAAWCGPCRALTPALERAAEQRQGKVELVKVDVDANQQLAARYGVQGIPAVKAFRDGEVADEFVGAIPQAEVERFFDKLVPSEADALAAEGDEDSLRRALELDPSHAGAAAALARTLLERGDAQGALEVLQNVAGDFVAEGLAARAKLIVSGTADEVPEIRDALDALATADYERGLERLEAALAVTQDETRDLVRQVMVGIFTELGPDHPLAREYRRKLATALY